MKANRKFRSGDDQAVSPVIAVILMVAITVVLAATVYVWVSGFGSNSGSSPAKSMALTSGAAMTTNTDLDGDATVTDDYKLYVVSAASPGMRYGDITITLNGAPAALSAGGCDTTLTNLATAGAVGWIGCSAAFSASSAVRATTDIISAGDHIYVFQSNGVLASQTLRILDPASNSVMLTLTVS